MQAVEQRVHFGIRRVRLFERLVTPAEIPGSIDQCLGPALQVVIACLLDAEKDAEAARGVGAGKSREQVDNLAAWQAGDIFLGHTHILRHPVGADDFGAEGRRHRHTLAHMRLAILAHQRMRLEGAFHRGVRIIRAEQLRIVLHIFGVFRLGQHCASGRLHAKDGRLVAQSLVDRVGVFVELLQGDAFIKRCEVTHLGLPFIHPRPMERSS